MGGSSLKIEFTIYGIPRTKKNSQQILRTKAGRPFITQSKVSKQFESDSIMQVPQYARIGIDVPCVVTTIFFMPDNRRVDLSNLISASHDILVRSGVLKDDNRKIAAVINAWAETDKANPRTCYTVEVIK